MSNNQERLDKIAQDYEQLQIAFDELKTGMRDYVSRLERLADIHERLTRSEAARRDREFL